MPSESVKRINEMLRRPRPVYAMASDGQGHARFVPLEVEPEGDDQTPAVPRRVVDGTANELLRELAFGAYARRMRQGN